MGATIRGQVNDLPVMKTGLWSLDRLMTYRNLPGLRLRQIIELYAHEGVGKSTLAAYLAAKIKPTGIIELADLENATEEHHLISNVESAGFEGEVHVIESVDGKGLPRTHESIVTEAADALLKDEINACIIDSVGAFAPIAEVEGDIGDSNMGRRAFAMGQLSRRLTCNLRLAKDAKLAFLINHVHPNIGSKGHDTPGGVSKKHLSGTRVMLYRREIFEEGGTLVEARCEKRRWGGVVSDSRGYFVIVPGYGISKELSAVFDCIDIGLATRERVLKLGDKSFGYMNKMFEKALSEDKSDFVPFMEALENYEPE